MGNRLSLTTTAGVVNYQYDDANRMVMTGGVPVGWDDNGNMTSFGSRTYEYDHANRVTSVTSGTLTTAFTYNGAGDRVAKTVDGVTTDYVLDPAAGLTQVLVESTGGESTSYLYGHDLLAQYDSGTWAYHVNDGLGSVRQLADPTGQVVQNHSFSPFGVPLGESGGEPYGYTGEQWDASAGLVYLRARYYEPGVGRFVSKDPWPGMVQKPGTLNGYTYVLNNVPNGTDPSGMWCLFGIGNCDEEPDLAIVAYYILVQTDFCLPGDLGCWGGEPQGIGWEDIKELQDSGEFYEDMYWTYYHWAEAWGLSEEDLRTLLIQNWFFEKGSQVDWDFDESHSATQALMNHEGVRRYRNEFYRSGCQDIGDRNNPADHGEWYSPGDATPMDRLLGESDWDRVFLEGKCEGVVAGQILLQIEYNEASVCGTLGSYAVKILNNQDGTATFEVYNPTSWQSFLRPPFEWMPTLGRPGREETSPNWLCDEGCGGNVYQRFRWTEDIPLGVCGGCP